MSQIGTRNDIELLAVLDNRRRTVGVKRQNLLDMAQGEYVVYLDDDDDVADDYVESIMGVLDNQQTDLADVIVFQVQYTHLATGQKILCIYDKAFKDRGVGNDGVWRGPPCHIHAIRSDLAKSVRWVPEDSTVEDFLWSNGVAAKINKQVKIDRPLYFYNYDPSISESLKRVNRLKGRS
ncbi:MAG: glycosyltransferase [Candidatus Thorarchaeota archaeon]